MTMCHGAISHSKVAERFSGRTDTFVELKTSMSIRNAGDEARFEKCVHSDGMVEYLLIIATGNYSSSTCNHSCLGFRSVCPIPGSTSLH